jgi:alcohol dehydrogenase
MQAPVFPFRMPNMVLAGVGAVEQIGDEVNRLGAKKPFLVTDRGLRQSGLPDRVISLLAARDLEAGVFDDLAGEPSLEDVDRCLALLQGGDHDCVIGLGGGSSMDVAKVVAMMATNGGNLRDYLGVDKVQRRSLPLVQIPTTAGTGSEVTWNAVFADKQDHLKKAVVSPYLTADCAILDPVMTVSSPPRVAAYSGIDALTHAIESYTSPKATMHTGMYALESIQLIARNLRTAYYSGKDIEAREGMLMGSFFAGVSLANAGAGAVHALAYPLGGQFGTVHGLANGLLLPYVLEVNFMASLDKFADIAEAMGADINLLTDREAAYKAVEEVRTLGLDVGIPARLRDIDVPRQSLDGMATAAAGISRLLDNNPRWLDRDSILKIYEAAW